MNSVLSSLILSALLLIQFDISVLQSWIRVIASCTAVVLFAHCRYVLAEYDTLLVASFVLK